MATRPKKQAQQYISECVVEDDGIRPVREAKPHSADKLTILAAYLPAFMAATSQAPRRYFVDALAGPGLYHFAKGGPAKGTIVEGKFVKGSTLIAREAQPPFDRILAMDIDTKNVEALNLRTAGDARVVVKRGDCNKDLLPLMEAQLADRRAPVFVFVDPEGFEVEWSTVERLSQFRQGRKKTELLIYFAAPSLARFTLEGMQQFAMNVDRAMPPGRQWRKILQAAKERGADGKEIAREMVNHYATALRETLGYGHVTARPIGPSGPEDRGGRVFYYLVYATDFVPTSNEGPMDWIFANLWGSSSAQPPLF
jgi:three-Cys-motif partner protein